MSDSYYAKLGVRPVINANGNMTVLGGSIISPEVRRAMDEAGDTYVEMRALQQKSGEHIADNVGVEAAHVTSGAAAALALSAAACMAGKDPDKIALLPDTTGMKNEFLIQKSQRYVFDRLLTVPGGVLVEVGDEDGCTKDQLDSAIGPKTAAVAYRVEADRNDSEVSLEDAVRIAHTNNVPVVADAASQIYPIDYFRRTAQSADLVCFGAKYIGAPHSSGFVCGTKEMVEAVAAQDFIGFETGGHTAFGRAMKVDRQEIVGVVAALDAWLAMNHEDRLLELDAKAEVIQRGLQGVPSVETRILRTNAVWLLTLFIFFDPKVSGKSAEQIADELAEGDPSIWLGAKGEDTLAMNVVCLKQGEDRIIADRLKSALSR